MNKKQVARWMGEHPNSIHGAPEAIISRCVKDIRRAGSTEAWTRAKEIVDREHHAWEARHGNHASPGYVAKEICTSLAKKMRSIEPVVVAGLEHRRLERETREALEPDAMEEIRPWLYEIAVKEEHEEWLRIVEFIRMRGMTIAREQHLSSDPRWQSTWEYGEAAAMVTEILSQEVAEHIH